MKKFIIISTVILFCSCTYLKGVFKSEKKEAANTATADTTAVQPQPQPAVVPSIDTMKMKVSVSTLPLRAVGDSIRVQYKISFPEGSVAPNEKLVVIPVITYTDRKIVGDS
ncbi:MAG: hypothetical protein RR550_00975, partial [Rikenellaceae bacterium]